jgi:hypothetical protein
VVRIPLRGDGSAFLIIDEEPMRNLLALLGFALVAFLGVGYYLDWYHVAPKASETTGHRTVEIDINSKKIGDDVHKGVEAVEKKGQDLLDKNDKTGGGTR